MLTSRPLSSAPGSLGRGSAQRMLQGRSSGTGTASQGAAPALRAAPFSRPLDPAARSTLRTSSNSASVLPCGVQS